MHTPSFLILFGKTADEFAAALGSLFIFFSLHKRRAAREPVGDLIDFADDALIDGQDVVGLPHAPHRRARSRVSSHRVPAATAHHCRYY